jgi:TM2 domain-containing membrane protein YozV
MTRPKHKTTATWLALTLGSFGLHRFYLRGWGDWIGWLFPIPTALGWWGIDRAIT